MTLDSPALSVAGAGPEAFSRLYCGTGFRRAWLGQLNTVNERAGAFLPAFLTANRAALRAEMLSDEGRGAALALRGRLERGSGAHESHGVLGSDTGGSGMHTCVRLRFEAGDATVTLTRGEKRRLAAIERSATMHPFPVSLRAVSAAGFEGRRTSGDAPFRVRSETGSDSAPKALVPREPDGPGSVDPRSPAMR